MSFEGAGLTTDATVRLATAEWLVGTRRLSLAGNGLRDPAARALAESDRVRGLTLLDLSANSFTLAGVERLLASSHLRDCHFRLVGNPHLLDDHHAVRRLLGPRGSV